MIYNIHGFQHAKLLEFGLDNDDALILRAITGMYASPRMECTTINGIRYIWVNQDYLQRQIRVIGSKRTVMRRVNKMIEKGILSSHTLYSKKGVKGTYYYIAPTEKLDRLRDMEPYDNMSKGQTAPYDKMSKGGTTKCPTKDTINNIDSNNNTNIYIASSEEKEPQIIKEEKKIQSIYDEWKKANIINHRRMTRAMQTKIKSALKDYTEEEIKQSIRNYGYIVNSDNYFFSHRWTLDQFCTITQKDRIGNFLDLEVAKNNYRANKGDIANGGNEGHNIKDEDDSRKEHEEFEAEYFEKWNF